MDYADLGFMEIRVNPQNPRLKYQNIKEKDRERSEPNLMLRNFKV